MHKQKTEVDIVNEILEACIIEYPVSSFIISLYKQYMQRGSLSKKQLQGLFGKAAKIQNLPPGKLATLEAVIKKMPTRYKSELPSPTPLPGKDESLGEIMDAILVKYPQHKRVIYLKLKYDKGEKLNADDLADLKRFEQILLSGHTA